MNTGKYVRGYRFTFQSQESDDEIRGKGNSLNYKFRMHDPRIGRFFAVDPLAAKYPWNSSYAFSENKITNGIEVEGLEQTVTIDGRIVNGPVNIEHINARVPVADRNAFIANIQIMSMGVNQENYDVPTPKFEKHIPNFKLEISTTFGPSLKSKFKVLGIGTTAEVGYIITKPTNLTVTDRGIETETFTGGGFSASLGAGPGNISTEIDKDNHTTATANVLGNSFDIENNKDTPFIQNESVEVFNIALHFMIGAQFSLEVNPEKFMNSNREE